MSQTNYTPQQQPAAVQPAAGKPGPQGMAIADNRPATIQRRANNTGLPDKLKTGIENLSGMAMDHVQVHYNSAQPAQLNAHAYAQGSQIHVAPGQEKHLPHEAWHVVQQAQGRVQPTMQMKGGVQVNDSKALEKEADTMGAKALQLKQDDTKTQQPPGHAGQKGCGCAACSGTAQLIAFSQEKGQPSPAAAESKKPAAAISSGGVLQPQWATDQATGERLNLKKTDDPNVFIKSSTQERYRLVRIDPGGIYIVTKMQDHRHDPYRYDQYGTYSGWDRHTQGVREATPFGGSISAYHNRGAPKVGSSAKDFGGAKVGDSYTDYVSGLRSGGKTDAELAQALLMLDNTVITTNMEKRAGAMLHYTVYLSEEWRKQGAAKIYRACLRLIAEGKRTFDDFLSDFKFIASADDGRNMVARIYDVFNGVVDKSELPDYEEGVFNAMSPASDDDFSSDDDLRDREHKELSSKSRLFAKHHEDEKKWRDPWP